MQLSLLLTRHGPYPYHCGLVGLVPTGYHSTGLLQFCNGGGRVGGIFLDEFEGEEEVRNVSKIIVHEGSVNHVA